MGPGLGTGVRFRTRTTALGAPAGELCFESGAVRIVPTDHRAMYAFCGACALVAFLLDLASTMGSLFISAIICGISFELACRARPALVRVALDAAGELAIEGRRKRVVVERSAIVNCWQLSRRTCSELVIVTRRAWISIAVPDREAASALARALADTTRQLVVTTLSAPPVTPKRQRGFVRRYPVLVGFAALTLLVAQCVGVFDESPSLFGAGLPATVLVVLTAFVCGIARETNPVRVLVGRDGVQLARRRSRGFIGYERIRHVRCEGDAVVLRLVDGETIRLPIFALKGKGAHSTMLYTAWRYDPKKCRVRRETLAAQVDGALERFRAAGTPAGDVGRILGRGTRTIVQWQRALAQPDAYRGRHVGSEDLLEILENPRVDSDQRLGAALALAARPDQDPSGPERALRVRAAIASSANQRVRIALEKAEAGTLDDAAYEAAVERKPARRRARRP